MTLTVEAVYENGVLKPTQPLPLAERDRVQITIHSKTNWVEETAGILGWTGPADDLRRLALSPELDLEDDP